MTNIQLRENFVVTSGHLYSIKATGEIRVRKSGGRRKG